MMLIWIRQILYVIMVMEIIIIMVMIMDHNNALYQNCQSCHCFWSLCLSHIDKFGYKMAKLTRKISQLYFVTPSKTLQYTNVNEPLHFILCGNYSRQWLFHLSLIWIMEYTHAQSIGHCSLVQYHSAAPDMHKHLLFSRKVQW